MAESILEQLRIQDGKLFQNEQVMTLYVDTKRLVLDNILLALSTSSDLKPFTNWSPEMEKHLMASLTCSPKLLENVLSFYGTLLDNTHVRSHNANMGKLLQGLFFRFCSNPNVKNGSIQMLDPIKQDFICREIFRSTLVCDCMTIFKEPNQVLRSEIVLGPCELIQNENINANKMVKDDIGPNDIGPKVPNDIGPDEIGPNGIDIGPDDIGPDDSASQFPKESNTVVSMSTMLTATMKKPKNIRRIVLDDDAYSTMTKLR